MKNHKRYTTQNENLSQKAKNLALSYLSDDLNEDTRKNYQQLSVLIEACIQKILEIEPVMKKKTFIDNSFLEKNVKGYFLLNAGQKKLVEKMFKEHIVGYLSNFGKLKYNLMAYADHLDDLPDNLLDKFFEAVSKINFNLETTIVNEEKAD
ncbi:hypothetical protein AD998_07485 [bacterium 336/3]|nr:hypothetical protein AD998_07485 [bacterium 336/3]